MKVIVDGMGEVYRQYYMVKLSNSKNVPTGAVYGFLKAVIGYSLQFGCKPIIAWEGGNLYRKEIYPRYKEGRGEKQEDVYSQEVLIKKLMSYLGVQQYFADRREADDVMFTLSKKFSVADTVFLITADSDMFQAVTDNVFVFNPRLKLRFNKEAVFAKLGVIPSDVVFLKAILGDSTDNIEGIKRLPYKIMCSCIYTYKSVDELLKDKHNLMTPKVREKLVSGMEIIQRNLKLVTLCNIENELTEIPLQKDRKLVEDTLYELEFNSYIKEKRDKIDKLFQM